MPHTTPEHPPTLYVTLGLPASGKSTHAKKMVLAAGEGRMARVNKDDLRAMTHGYWDGNTTEKHIVAARDALVVRHLAAGVDTIVDDTNIAGPHLRKLSELAWESGALFEVLDFTDVPVEVCIDRDANREAKVGEKVIRRMAAQLASRRPRPTLLDPIVPDPPRDPALPDAVLFDVDGTLAHMTGRNPYDLSRLGEDRPDEQVIEALLDVKAAGKTPIIFTGRDSGPDLAYFHATAAWLREHVAADLLHFQRGTDDNRRDSIVKYEMYNTHIRGRFNVRRVYDDRDQVVRMWRTLGLTCMQVAPGAF